MAEGEPMCGSDDAWVDLASRDNDGLEITLLWNESSGRVKVAVADSRLGDEFELDVARTDALGAFSHPFAYAADGRAGSGRSTHASTDLQLQG
jgi:hypothetical protein